MVCQFENEQPLIALNLTSNMSLPKVIGSVSFAFSFGKKIYQIPTTSCSILQLVQSIVESLFIYELIVVSGFNNTAPVKDENAVGIANG